MTVRVADGRAAPSRFDAVLWALGISTAAFIATGVFLTLVGLPIGRDVLYLGCEFSGAPGHQDYVCPDGIGYAAGGLIICAVVALVVFAVVLVRGSRAAPTAGGAGASDGPLWADPSRGGVMSTLPGHESWRDAGLVEDDETDPKNLVEEIAHPDPRGAGEDYHPGTARPDLDDLAEEADVIDQSVVVPEDDADAEGN